MRVLAVIGVICIGVSAWGADIDTTGGTIVLNFDNPANRYFGDGTLQISDDGGGFISLAQNSGVGETDFELGIGGLITIDAGVTLNNGGWQKGIWTSNQAAMQVNGSLNMRDGNEVYVDGLSGAGTITITNNGAGQTLRLGVAGGSGVFSGTMTQDPGRPLAIRKEGNGTQTLSGVGIDFHGGIDAQDGVLVLQGTTALGNGNDPAQTWNVGGGAVLNVENPGYYPLGTTSGSGLTISGAGTFRKTGAGRLALGNQGSDDYEVVIDMAAGGLIDIVEGSFRNGGWQGKDWTGNEGAISIATGAEWQLWDGNDIYVDGLNGGGQIVYGYTPGSERDRELHVGVADGSGDFSGELSPNDAASNSDWVLHKDGSGTQTLSGTDNNVGLSAIVNSGVLELAKDSSGAVHAIGAGTSTVNSGGTVRLAGNGDDQILDASQLDVNAGGTLDLNGRNETVNTMNVSGAITNSDAGASTLSGAINNSGGFIASGTGDLQIDASIDGAGGLTKNGANSVTLTNAGNTFSGDLLVNQGVLALTDPGALGGVTNVHLGTNGVFDVTAIAGGAGYSAAGITFSGDGMLDATGGSLLMAGANVSPGNSPDSMAFAGGMVGFGTYTWDLFDTSLAPGTGWDVLAGDPGATFTFDGPGLDIINIVGLDATMPMDNLGVPLNLDLTPGAISTPFTILEAPGGITNPLSVGNVIVNLGNLSGLGTFNLAVAGVGDTLLQLTFTAAANPIPEPSTYALFALVLFAGIAWRRRMRSATKA